jgi:D-alanyl-D-alanine carboxypeptidase
VKRRYPCAGLWLRSVILLAINLATFTPAVAHAAAEAATLADELQAVLDDFLAANPQAPGVTAWIACPPLSLDWSGAAGRVARGATEALTPAHSFRIASNTKTYVAATVLRLAESGRLSLDAPLADLLAAELAAPLAADGYDLQSITVRQVLSHTAGLADHSGDNRYGEAIIADPQHAWTRLEQVRRCTELFDPLGPAPAPYRYSDTGYVLLGGIIERVTGQPLGTAVREQLDFASLGLNRTWWEYTEAAPAAARPRAHQYIDAYDTTDWNASFDLFGGGGLVTDTCDLGRFMRALLEGQVLRQEASLAAMTGGGTAVYRLGLMVVDLDGRLAIGHQGFWNTFAFHLPGLDATVAGSILSHDAANGRVLAARLAATLAARKATAGK